MSITIANDNEYRLPLSQRLLQPLVGAIGHRAKFMSGCTLNGHDAAGAYVPAVRTGVVTTRASKGEIATELAFWSRRGCDYLVMRHGPFPETLDDVFVDVAIRIDDRVVIRQDLMLFRGLDRSLFAMADRPQLFVRIGRHGLTFEKKAPYADRDERSDGLTRAAAEIVRTARARRWGR